jgi:glycine/D-amino acid oxidase-like deaminating enzyme
MFCFRTPPWHAFCLSPAVQYDSSFAVAVEWQEAGSLLLGQTKEEAEQLEWRHDMLAQHGITSQLLSREALKTLEPGLALPQQGSGLLVQTDAQIVSRSIDASWPWLHRLAQARSVQKLSNQLLLNHFGVIVLALLFAMG